MSRQKICIILTAVLLFALAGCASFNSQPDGARIGYKPKQIRVAEKDNFMAFCAHNHSALGCAVRLRETNQCIVFVKSGLALETHGCVVRHEATYCIAEDHEASAFKSNSDSECGDGEKRTVALTIGSAAN